MSLANGKTFFDFSHLPLELQLRIMSHLDISDIERRVRPATKAWRTLANDFQLWKEIANKIGYAIPKAVGREDFYESVKTHIIDVRRKALCFPEQVFEREKGTHEENDNEHAPARISLLEEEISIANIREIKMRMEAIEFENTITAWKAIQEEMPTLTYPDFNTLDNDTDRLAISKIFHVWIVKNNEHLSKLQKFSLFSRKISYLPEALRNFTNLKVLDIGHNTLSYIPSWLGELTHLRELCLDGNQISSLPEQVRDLKELEKLDIQHNRTWLTLSASIKELPQLRELNLSFCFVEKIPEEIKRLPQLEINLEGTQLNKKCS